MPKLKLTIVTPVYNEEQVILSFHERTRAVLDKMEDVEARIVFVVDRSTDNTLALLRDAAAKDTRTRVLALSSRFGHQMSLLAGIENSLDADAIVMMDSDLQHPPEIIPQLVMAWQGGAKMVYAIRRNRDTDTDFRKFSSKLFYLAFRHAAEIRLPEGAGDFRLLDRVVIDAVNALPERTRFMKGLMTWVGYDYALVPFDVAPRPDGHSSWDYLRLVRFAFDGLSSFSTLPLRIWTWFGSVISLLALAYGIFLALRTLLFGNDVPGFATLVTGIMFLGGVQLLSLGIIGEYLGRVFTEVKGRPVYLINEQQGFDPHPDDGN